MTDCGLVAPGVEWQRHDCNNPGPAGHQPWEFTVRKILFLILLAAGCASVDRVVDESQDYDRHRYSRLVQPFNHPEKIYFDVAFPTDFPADDPAAEAARMAWLKGWLKQRRLCDAGYEVTVRRPFDFLEDNPAGYQQRWEIRCLAPSGK